MLNKIIATTISLAVLANVSMIASANESNVEKTFSDESNVLSDSLETTAAAEDLSTEAATTPEVSNPADEGTTIRKSLDVTVTDVVFFDEEAALVTTKGKEKMLESGERIWIVGVDDAGQRFRVYVPRLYDGLSSTIYYLGYADCIDAQIDSEEEGLVIGDLTNDGVVDVFDMCLMRRGYIYGWNSLKQYYMADMNADGFVSISDLIYLQRWLLGVIK